AAAEEETQAGSGGVEPAHGSCSGEGWAPGPCAAQPAPWVRPFTARHATRSFEVRDVGDAAFAAFPDLAGAPHAPRSTSSSAAAKRRQLSISSPSTRRPAAVI